MKCVYTVALDGDVQDSRKTYVDKTSLDTKLSSALVDVVVAKMVITKSSVVLRFVLREVKV